MKIKKRILTCLLTLTLTMTSLPLQLFAQEIADISLPMSGLADSKTTTSGAIEIKPTKYVGDGYEVEFKVANQWAGAFNGEFVLTNTSDELLENWALKFDFEHEITNMWNARILKHEGTSYIIKNMGHNQDITPGSSINIGFQANWNDNIKVPKSYDLLITKQEVEKSDYTIDFKVTGDWGQAFNAQMSITNNTEEVIEDWNLEFDFDKNIERFWTAEIVEHEGEHYVIKNAGYNADIAPGQTITLGFSGNPGNVASSPINYKLYKVANIQSKADQVPPIITVNTSELRYDQSMSAYIIDQKLDVLTGVVTEDSDIASLSYIITCGNLELKSTNIMPSKEWSIENIPLLIGKNSITIIAKDCFSNIGTTTIDLFNLSEENMQNVQLDKNDDDSDGLLNYQEMYYGTDPLNPDTDSDGLNDLQELITTITDPLKIDTDSNGITDEQEDFDQDGIINIDELRLNANPYSSDTDFDDLKDNEEVTHGTKLDEYDTDNDGLSDNREVELGTDPLNSDTDSNGILDGDEIFNVVKTILPDVADTNIIPTVEVGIAGKLINTLHISKVDGNGLHLSKEIPGYIGAGYEFDLGGTFEVGTLTFKFDSKLLNIEGFEPAIYYCDVENQEMILLENQNVDLTNCTVSAPITHFSKYILLNKNAYSLAWMEVIEGPKDKDKEELNKPIDIVFAIDSSGSMSSNDRQKVRMKVAKDFVDRLGPNDRAAVVDFDSWGYITCHLTNDKIKVKKAIDMIDSYGGTSLTEGMKKALEELIVFIEDDISTFSSIQRITLPLEEGQINGLDIDGNIIVEDQVNDNSIDSTQQMVSSIFSDTKSRDSMKYVIMLTDGEGDYYEPLNELAARNNIAVYTVGLGNSIDENLLKRIANQTSGKYYHAAVANDLIKEFEKLIQNIVDSKTDSDDDGLSDYHEERLRAYDGTRIKVEKDNPDTDNDGIPDGEEVIAVYDKDNNINHYKMISDPTNSDTDGDGILDKIDPEKMLYNITDRTLALISGLSYSNLESYVGKSVGEILNSGVRFENLEYEYAKEIKDAEIIFSNKSGIGWQGDVSDGGLGSVAVKIRRPGKNDVIIYGLRGTEPDKDAFNDWFTDGMLGLGWFSAQSGMAFQQYKSVSGNKNSDYFLTGHSLGGRLVQDVIYKIYNSNEDSNKISIPTPIHSATFNGLGYNKLVYKTLENDILKQYRYKLYNYYFKGDLVGNSFGANPNGTFVTAGETMPFIAKNKQGDVISVSSTSYEFDKVHDIKLWHCSPDFKYPNIIFCF